MKGVHDSQEKVPKVGTLMAGHEILHVAVPPPDRLEANLVEKVAAIVNKDLYGTRLLLVGKFVSANINSKETMLR